jgi:hypothetical protein
LSRAAEWFRAQRISRVDTEEIEIETNETISENLVEKLLEQS